MNKGDTAWPYDGCKNCIEIQILLNSIITELFQRSGPCKAHTWVFFPYFCLATKGLEDPILIFDLLSSFKAHGFIYPFRVH